MEKKTIIIIVSVVVILICLGVGLYFLFKPPTTLDSSNYDTIKNNKRGKSKITTIGYFSNYEGEEIIINGDEYKNLKKITEHAFYENNKKIIISGSFLNLETIGVYAFAGCKNTESRIEIKGAPMLQTIGYKAFFCYDGNLIINGSFPMLKSIGMYSFMPHICDGDKLDTEITIRDATNLEYIGDEAFLGAKNINITGSFPKLKIIGKQAFASLIRARGRKHSKTNKVSITDAKELGEIGTQAFYQSSSRPTLDLTLKGNFTELYKIGDYALKNFVGGEGNNDKAITMDIDITIDKNNTYNKDDIKLALTDSGGTLCETDANRLKYTTGKCK